MKGMSRMVRIGLDLNTMLIREIDRKRNIPKPGIPSKTTRATKKAFGRGFPIFTNKRTKCQRIQHRAR